MKLVLKFVVFLLVTLTVLVALAAFAVVNIGADSTRARGIMEHYIAKYSGYDVAIAELNDLKIYPDVVVDLDGVSLTDPASGEQVGRVAHVDFSAGLMDLVRGTYAVKSLNVRSVAAASGVVMAQPVVLDKVTVEVSRSDDKVAHLMIDGTIGAEPLTGFIGLANKGTMDAPLYGLGDDLGFEVTLNGISTSAIVSQPEAKLVQLSRIEVMQGDEKLLHGDIALKMGGKQRITGDVFFGEHSQLQPDVSIAKNGVVRGDLVFPKVDVKEVAGLAAAVAKLQEVLEPEDSGNGDNGVDSKAREEKPIDLAALNLDLTIDMQQLLLDGAPLGAQKIAVKASKGALNVAAADGVLAGGASDLAVNVKPSGGSGSDLHDVDVSFDVDALDVASALAASGQASDEVNIKLDGTVDLGAQVSRWSELKNALNGRVAVTAEEGAFESRWLEAWAGGLGTLILPNFDPRKQARMNCLAVDATASNSIFDFGTLFMDGRNVRLVGKGTYNAAVDNLDMKITPKTKDISIGDLSTSVRVKGKIADPSIRPDAVDAGKKAAGLLLGALNPALLAVTANDLNLNLLGGEDVEDSCAVLAGLPEGNKAKAFAARDVAK